MGVQQGAGGRGLIEDRLSILGSAFLLAQAVHPLLLEGADRVVDGSDGTTDLRGDRGCVRTVGAGQ
jgi:hypothetical protein